MTVRQNQTQFSLVEVGPESVRKELAQSRYFSARDRRAWALPLAEVLPWKQGVPRKGDLFLPKTLF